MNVKPKNKRFYYILIGVGIILILSSFFGGRSLSNKFWKKEINQRDRIANNLKDSIGTLRIEIDDLLIQDNENETVQYRYIDNSNYWKQQYELLRQDYNDILTRQYSNEYLDSLAKHVLFK